MCFHTDEDVNSFISIRTHTHAERRGDAVAPTVVWHNICMCKGYTIRRQVWNGIKTLWAQSRSTMTQTPEKNNELRNALESLPNEVKAVNRKRLERRSMKHSTAFAGHAIDETLPSLRARNQTFLRTFLTVLSQATGFHYRISSTHFSHNYPLCELQIGASTHTRSHTHTCTHAHMRVCTGLKWWAMTSCGITEANIVAAQSGYNGSP